MHISLTPELENLIKEKVESGLYSNASEVVREALRFMKVNEELVYTLKLNSLQAKPTKSEAADIASNRYQPLAEEELDSFCQKTKHKAFDRIAEENR